VVFVIALHVCLRAWSGAVIPSKPNPALVPFCLAQIACRMLLRWQAECASGGNIRLERLHEPFKDPTFSAHCS
jgi:hypothetical protein